MRKSSYKRPFSWDKCQLMFCVESCKTVPCLICCSFPFLSWFIFLFIKYSMHFFITKDKHFVPAKLRRKVSCLIKKQKSLNQCFLKIDWQTQLLMSSFIWNLNFYWFEAILQPEFFLKSKLENFDKLNNQMFYELQIFGQWPHKKIFKFNKLFSM